MNNSTYRFTLDLRKHNSQMSIAVFRHDTAVTLNISLTDGGKPYFIEDGCTAFLSGKRADDRPLLHRCMIKENTEIIYDFEPATSSIAGIVKCDIRLFGIDGKLITAPRFTIVVDERLVTDDDIDIGGTSTLSALDQILASEQSRIDAERNRAGTWNTLKANIDSKLSNIKDGDSIHVRYSADADPNGSKMSETWETGMDYIGVATAQECPTDKSGFVWLLFRGEKGKDGTDGTNGTDGITPTIEVSADGYWVINGVKTMHRAIGTDGTNGTDGKDGGDGAPGKDGTDGKDGISVTNTEINNDGELVITFSTGSTKNVGKVVGNKGTDGKSISSATVNSSGQLVLTFNDGTTVNAGNVVGAAGKDGTSVNILGSFDSSDELPTTNNSKGDAYLIEGVIYIWDGTKWKNGGNIQGPGGKDGDTITSASINTEGQLLLTLSSGTTLTVGKVVGSDGVTPTFKIENGQLSVSYNSGTNWTALGIVKGADGVTPTIEISNDGYWIINGVPTEHKAIGVDGTDGTNGTNGVTPTIEISEDGYWIINGDKTDHKAVGTNGTDGTDGTDGITPTIEISNDGYWIINGVKTEHKAVGTNGTDGTDGTDGITPTIEISNDGYWIINGVKTEHKAIGTNGTPGNDGNDGVTPTFKIENGKIYVSYNNGLTWSNLGNIKGADGTSVSISEISKKDGTTVVLFSDQNIISINDGIPGENGKTPYIQDGKWYINGIDQGVKAAGVTVSSTTESTDDAGGNVVSFSDGESITIRNGSKGSPGKSAFEIACEKGFEGTEQDWLDYLNGYTKTIQTTDGDILRVFVGTQDEYNDLDNTENLFAIITDDPTKPEFDAVIAMMVTKGLDYTLSDDETYYICSGIGTATGSSNLIDPYIDLIIPSTYEGLPVTKIADSAFRYAYIKSVTIPDSITSIGKQAFEGCFNLKDVSIGDGVTSIGEYAFSACNLLNRVTMGNGVTSIGKTAFGQCKNLISIVIPDGCTTIGDGAFSNCTNIISITIPDSVTSIGRDAFAGCKSLKTVNIPNGVTSLSGYTFDNCISLETITIPETVTSMGNRVFYGCKSLRIIYIPISVTSMGANVFESSPTEVWCEADEKPDGWDSAWSGADDRTIYWGELTKPNAYNSAHANIASRALIADLATKATQDSEGNVITDTYEKKAVRASHYMEKYVMTRDDGSFALSHGYSDIYKKAVGVAGQLSVIDPSDNSTVRVVSFSTLLHGECVAQNVMVPFYRDDDIAYLCFDVTIENLYVVFSNVSMKTQAAIAVDAQDPSAEDMTVRCLANIYYESKQVTQMSTLMPYLSIYFE